MCYTSGPMLNFRDSISVTNICRATVALLILSHFFGCATLPKHPLSDESKIYISVDNKTLLGRFAPLFVIEEPGESYNLIGSPAARLDKKGGETVFVDPGSPAFFTEERTFQTKRGSYKNIAYRVHFEKIPFGLFPFYLGTGKNVGLFVIVTLNEREEPLLYTTVHTCGCYLAFIPTSHLPADAFPKGWDNNRQTVFGENLPGLLDYGKIDDGPQKTMLLLRSGSHRVKDVWLEKEDEIKKNYHIVQTQLISTEALEHLPLKEGGEASFFETSGGKEGYVKGAGKPWERLFMSWWAFDWRIGEDKKLGINKADGPLFYTSLKPWAREDSDMRDFAAFLEYWGWRL